MSHLFIFLNVADSLLRMVFRPTKRRTEKVVLSDQDNRFLLEWDEMIGDFHLSVTKAKSLRDANPEDRGRILKESQGIKGLLKQTTDPYQKIITDMPKANELDIKEIVAEQNSFDQAINAITKEIDREKRSLDELVQEKNIRAKDLHDSNTEEILSKWGEGWLG